MFCKVVKYHIIMLILVGMNGCAKIQQPELETGEKVNSSVIKSSPSTVTVKKESKLSDKMQNRHYYAFNNQKFRSSETLITAGVKVFDMQLNTVAYVTNKVVAVLKDSSKFREKAVLQALVTNSKIVTNRNVRFHFVSDGVLEVIFENKQTNMLEMYKTLAEMQIVTQAELLLQYQGRSTAQEY